MKLVNNKQIYFIAMFAIVMIVGVGYAIINSNLNIKGNTTIDKSTWDVHFENINVTSGSSEATTPATIDSSKATINFEVALAKPGDFYEFTVDVENSGSLDAMINSIKSTGLNDVQKEYMTYTATYSDDIELAKNQELKVGAKETIKVRVEYRKDITAADLPSEDTMVDLTFSINYVQSNDKAVAIPHPVPTCKRAIEETLHTEICSNSSYGLCSSAGYAIGDKITYGKVGEKGTLASGDAFDCDINGDETFDSNTERFYYVSDLDTNSNYAVLIYYNNVFGGGPNNTTPSAYNPETNSNATAYLGPITAIQQLPTTTQWKNISLSNSSRNIKDELGTVRVSSFNYSGYAARLLTYQEVYNGCYSGTAINSPSGLDKKCTYLMENTKYSNNSLLYGYWLETVHSSRAGFNWWVFGLNRLLSTGVPGYNSNAGVRPVIEVPKTKISY